MADNVNHPSHYADSCSLECIDTMIIAFGYEYVFFYCLINAYKYVWRYKNKNGEEDVRKAEWYVNKATEIYDSGNANVPCTKLVLMSDLIKKIKATYKNN